METVAITGWNGIISPLYDASTSLFIIGPDGVQKVVVVKEMSLLEKADLCAKENVDLLICGAISNAAAAILADRRIRVSAWLCGSVDEVIASYRSNMDLTRYYALPGCCKKRCRGGRRRPGKNRHKFITINKGNR